MVMNEPNVAVKFKNKKKIYPSQQVCFSSRVSEHIVLSPPISQNYLLVGTPTPTPYIHTIFFKQTLQLET